MEDRILLVVREEFEKKGEGHWVCISGERDCIPNRDCMLHFMTLLKRDLPFYVSHKFQEIYNDYFDVFYKDDSLKRKYFEHMYYTDYIHTDCHDEDKDEDLNQSMEYIYRITIEKAD